MSETTIPFAKLMSDYVAQWGRRTVAVENFVKDLDQAFLIATLLKDAGLANLKEVADETNLLAQRLAGVDATELAAILEDEREIINSKATTQDNERIEILHRKASELNTVATETAPNVLFLFLITKFEAYIEDILTLLYKPRLNLIDAAEAEKKNKKNKPEPDIRERVQDLLSNEGMDWIGKNAFEKSLGLSLSDVYKAAQTSPTELDKAKGIRNIHLHSQGIVNRRNKDRIGLDVGTPCPITIDYLSDIKNKSHAKE